MTDECGSCEVPRKIENTNNQKYATRTDQGMNSWNDYFEITSAKALVPIEMSGNKWFSFINFQWAEYHRETSVNLNVFGISNANPNYKGKTEGFLGIAPYTQDMDNKGYNMMWQLKNAGLIDHNIISFWMSDEIGRKSMVKFGGFDH